MNGAQALLQMAQRFHAQLLQLWQEDPEKFRREFPSLVHLYEK